MILRATHVQKSTCQQGLPCLEYSGQLASSLQHVSRARHIHHFKQLACADVKNRRGRGKNKKITGIQAVPNAPQQTLITSNDSRIRVYNSYQLLCKYKGLHNANTQIKASFSEDGQHIICGSDDGACFVWNNAGDGQQGAQHQSSQIDFIAEKSSSFESFQAHDEITTVAIFAPTSLQILVSIHLSSGVYLDLGGHVHHKAFSRQHAQHLYHMLYG